MATKRGVTIVELVVGLSIFAIVTTLVVTTFVSISKVRTLSNNIRENQQKIRIATEVITRSVRQAHKLELNGDNLDLYYIDTTPKTGFRFAVESYQLPDTTSVSTIFQYRCLTDLTAENKCPEGSWGEKLDLLGNSGASRSNAVSLKDTDINQVFTTGATEPPTLDIVLTGTIGPEASSGYVNNTFNINTTVVMEGLR